LFLRINSEKPTHRDSANPMRNRQDEWQHVSLNRDIFTRTLIRELAGTLEEVVA
jgi:hypothetical protein